MKALMEWLELRLDKRLLMLSCYAKPNEAYDYKNIFVNSTRAPEARLFFLLFKEVRS